MRSLESFRDQMHALADGYWLNSGECNLLAGRIYEVATEAAGTAAVNTVVEGVSRANLTGLPRYFDSDAFYNAVLGLLTQPDIEESNMMFARAFVAENVDQRWRPNAAVIYLDKDNKAIIYSSRKGNGQLSIVQGGVEFGDSFLDTIRLEGDQEMGFRARDFASVECLGFYDNPTKPGREPRKAVNDILTFGAGKRQVVHIVRLDNGFRASSLSANSEEGVDRVVVIDPNKLRSKTGYLNKFETLSVEKKQLVLSAMGLGLTDFSDERREELGMAEFQFNPDLLSPLSDLPQLGKGVDLQRMLKEAVISNASRLFNVDHLNLFFYRGNLCFRDGNNNEIKTFGLEEGEKQQIILGVRGMLLEARESSQNS